MPPAGGEPRGELRATVGRLAHERFTDERVGELLEAAAPRDELEADVVRVARRDFDKARRVPGELVAELARAGVAARGAWLQAREADDFALFAPLPGAQHRAAPALQRVLPRGRAPLRPAARRLRAGHEHGRRAATPSSACATASSRSSAAAPGDRRRAAARRARSPRPASARCSSPCCARSASTTQQWRLDEAAHPFEATIAQTDVRLTTRYDEADLDSLYSPCTSSATASTSTRSTPRSSRTPLGGGRVERVARVAEPAVGEHGRPLARASGAGASRTRRRRCPSASPARRGRRSSGRPTPCARASSA